MLKYPYLKSGRTCCKRFYRFAPGCHIDNDRPIGLVQSKTAAGRANRILQLPWAGRHSHEDIVKDAEHVG
jgi:hypothetical protein